MIKMRTQFELMSIFVKEIASHRDQTTGNTGKRDRPEQCNSLRRRPKIQSDSSQASTLSQSRSSDTSPQSTSSRFKSPQKKKQHSIPSSANDERAKASHTGSVQNMSIDDDNSQSFPHGRFNMDSTLSITEVRPNKEEFPPLNITQQIQYSAILSSSIQSRSGTEIHQHHAPVLYQQSSLEHSIQIHGGFRWSAN